MARAPSQIGFTCESCGRDASVRQIRRWRGECGRCQEQSWLLYANYSDTTVKGSSIGVFSWLTLGIGWYSMEKVTNQTAAEGVSAEIARELTEDRSLLAARVVEYLRFREQEKLRARGAKSCRNCGILYVPLSEKPWTHGGYCTKSCAAEDGVSPSPSLQGPQEKLTRVPMIPVVCSNGHEFEVLASFSGCRRPCNFCGVKVDVP